MTTDKKELTYDALLKRDNDAGWYRSEKVWDREDDHNIHTTNIVGAWVPVPEDYDFENDFEAPSKLFWCKGPHGEGHWTNDELWEDCPEIREKLWDDDKTRKYEWFRNLDLKITHWAWVEGPKEMTGNKTNLKVGEPKE